MTIKKDLRALNRIDNRFGNDLTATITSGEKVIHCQVLEYNSLGLSLRSPLLIELTKNIDLLEMFYGSELICRVLKPKIIRHTNENLSLQLQEQSSGEKKSRQMRVVVSELQQGLLVGPDPVRINQVLYFRIVDISENGCKLKTSKSNRHLLPGLKLKNFDFLIPGLGNYKIDLTLTHSHVDDQNLYFGASWVQNRKHFHEEIKRYLLMNLPKALRKSYKSDGIQSLKIRKLKNLRVSRVTSNKDLEEILRVRLLAYQAAQKTKDGTSWEDMKDHYDENSIIYSAHFGQQLIGTMRLCFSSENSSLPFEEYLNFDQHLPFAKKSEVAEISRLAIDPDFQGTDVVLEMFKFLLVETGAKKIRYQVCLATEALSHSYKIIGAQQISSSFPHPVNKKENLSLYLFDPERVISGKMNSLGWFKVAKPSLKHLYRFQFIRKPALDYLKYIRFSFDFVQYVLQRKKMRKQKKKTSQKIRKID